MSFSAWAGMWTAPGSTLAAVARDPEGSRPGRAVAIMAGLWAAFSAALAVQGHAPSATHGLPWPARWHYGLSALYLLPLWWAVWWLQAWLADGLAARASGRRRPRATRAAMAYALAPPVTLAFLLPDILVWSAGGHDALGAVMPYYAPLAPVLILAWGVLGIRRVHGVGWGRAWVAAAGSWAVAALPVLWLVR